VKSRHIITSIAAIAAAAVLLAGCGGGSNSSTPATTSHASSSPAAGGGSNAVKISNFKFAPASLTVQHGAGVTVTNEDSAAHTATADDGTSFDTGDLAQGASQKINVSKPGTYPYHCTVHPFMKGTLVVR
jgi:plastocyanin